MKYNSINTSNFPNNYIKKTVVYIILRLIKYSLILVEPYCYLIFLNDVKSDASISEIEKSCEKANILSFINELSDKFETKIGENASGISGGQKQRIAIARLYLQNPDVFIFDEATSALDYKNESEILDLFLENRNDKTFFMVTHRDNLLDEFDHVIKID